MTPWQNGRANKVVTDSLLLHAKIKELCFVSSKTANVYTKHLVCARSCVKCGTWTIASFKSSQSCKVGTRSQLLCRQYGKGFKRGSKKYLRKGTDPVSGAHSGAGGGPRHLLRPRSAWPVRESRGPPGVGTASGSPRCGAPCAPSTCGESGPTPTHVAKYLAVLTGKNLTCMGLLKKALRQEDRMFQKQLPPEGKGDSGRRETVWKHTLSYRTKDILSPSSV